MIGRVVAYMIGSTVAVLALGELFQGGIVRYESVSGVLLFGLVIGLLNAFIKPVITLLTMPISCLTFGLFALVINAGLFYLATLIVPNISANVWGVLAGAALTSVLGGIIYSIVDE